MLVSGTTLRNRYYIIRLLGSGGFGDTYLAEDRDLPGNAQCVVKHLKPKSDDPEVLSVARRLFDSEAQVLHKLGNDSDQIPRLFAHLEENGDFYLVQEFVDGQDLSQELTPGKRSSEKEVVKLLQDILEVLKVVHENNVIHRDIKPQNIMRRQKDGKIVLIDFGAVKEISTLMPNHQGQTVVSVAVGTPGYMPSEQASGMPKYCSDVYAVGMMGIQALTGVTPNQLQKDPNTLEVIWRDRVQVNPKLADILDKMVGYHFSQRYQDAADALEAWESKTTIPWKVLIGSGIVLSIAAVGIFIVPNLPEMQTPKLTLTEQERANSWYDRGKELFKSSKYKEAIAAFERAIEINEELFDAWHNRGNALSKLGRYEEAIASYDRVFKIAPQSFWAWNNRGLALSELQRHEDAISSYEKAIDINPFFYNSWFNKGISLYHLKRCQEAADAFHRALQIKSDAEEAASWRKKAQDECTE